MAVGWQCSVLILVDSFVCYSFVSGTWYMTQLAFVLIPQLLE